MNPSSNSSSGQNYRYVVLYLTPDKIINQSKLLQLQWNNLKTLIPCLIESLYSGEVKVKMHDLDKIFTGIIKLENIAHNNILGRTASLWFYLTRIFHQSMGPRVGNFAEELLTYWINNSGNYSVIGRNISLAEALRKIANVYIQGRNKIDFVLKSKERIAFIEIRTSEHTGGRTAQESLLDKIVLILYFLEDSKVKLREKLESIGIREVDLSIAILFNENHELLTKENASVGRFTSLVNYIMEDRHVWGALEKLSGDYKLCDGLVLNKDVVYKRISDIANRQVCIQNTKSGFKVWLKILFGNEFFTDYVGLDFETLALHSDVIADDVWLFYSLLINEVKVARQYGLTNVRAVYEELKKNGSRVIREFAELYKKANLQLEDYIDSLNDLAETCAVEIMRIYSREGKDLRLLETNNITANFEYLKQVCLGSIAVYLHRDIDIGNTRRQCIWSL